jgi:amidase/aspartyl-tRNA(Asn)/glutamyl-tRNA(Gln) amidotransferase subunit A
MTILDLHQSLKALCAGSESAGTLIERSISAAQSQACQHAFLETTFDEARIIANDPRSVNTALGGLSVSIKDLFDVSGQPTRAASRVLADAAPAQQDCIAVARLRAAGGALIGRTHMSEFAFSAVGLNPHYATPSNICCVRGQRIPGGSSSGAAVSVATGAAFIGLGTDTGGSIRTPAALNGIVGFKNTARLVPLNGSIPLSPTLDTVCAMTRSVQDAILAHEILSARNVQRSKRSLASWRLAVPQTLMLDDLQPEVANAFEISLRTLRKAGAQIVEIALPQIRNLGALQSSGGFSAAESYDWHRDKLSLHSNKYDPRVAARIRRGETITGADYIELVHARRSWIAAVEDALQGFDGLLSPTLPIVAPLISEVDFGSERDDAFFRINALLIRNTSVVNMIDGCALTLPCHAPGELPVGLMIWHGTMRDDKVLNISLCVEDALARL